QAREILNCRVIVLYFFEVSRIAHYGAAVITRDDLTFVPVSNRVDVDSALDSRIVNAILVSARSAETWQNFTDSARDHLSLLNPKLRK
ncbi:MAG: hypothetical protein ACO3V4_07460, partial [Ilumatobacteraceae bacterium]